MNENIDIGMSSGLAASDSFREAPSHQCGCSRASDIIPLFKFSMTQASLKVNHLSVESLFASIILFQCPRIRDSF